MDIQKPYVSIERSFDVEDRKCIPTVKINLHHCAPDDMKAFDRRDEISALVEDALSGYDEAKEREIFDRFLSDGNSCGCNHSMWTAWQACAKSRAGIQS